MLVTGGLRGIGAAVVARLAAAGAQVVATARSAGSGTPAAHFIAGDLTTREGVEAVANRALKQLGSIDIIVNSVGAAKAYPAGSLAIVPDAWQGALDVNFLSPVRLNAARCCTTARRRLR